MLACRGRMVNDYEVIFNLPSQSTVACHSFKATVYQISKDLLQKIQHINEEFYSEFKTVSVNNQNALKISYLEKMKTALTFKSDKSIHKDRDIKTLAVGLMKEQLWDQNNHTLEMYSLKKHLNELPGFKESNCPIQEIYRTQKENLKQDNLLVKMKHYKPESYVAVKYNNVISNGKLPQNNSQFMIKEFQSQPHNICVSQPRAGAASALKTIEMRVSLEPSQRTYRMSQSTTNNVRRVVHSEMTSAMKNFKHEPSNLSISPKSKTTGLSNRPCTPNKTTS